MQVEETSIDDVKLIRPEIYSDARGFFFESWNERVFRDAGLDAAFVQDNHSRSARGTLRGLHYQIAEPQGKLVRAATGAIFDVAVDLRKSSPSFGRWVGATLSETDQEMLWIPPGFAHGYLVLSDTADVLYKCTDFFSPDHERTIQWNDVDLGIGWPLEAGVDLILSEKDRQGLPFRDADVYP